MFKAIVSYFWQNDDQPKDPLELEDAYNIISDTAAESSIQELDQNFEDDSENTVIEANEVFTKTGKVTKIAENGSYVIDDLYSFQSVLPDLSVGSLVSYQLIKESGELRVCNVVFLENDWNVIEKHKKTTWHDRTMLCQVARRDGRSVILSPGDIVVSLNNISSKFVPLVGDWVEFDVKCETDPSVTDYAGKILAVDNLRPVRPQLKSAKISSWDPTTNEGIIDRNIFFNKDALLNGYTPSKGEQVCVDIIESYQKQCVWRAVSVVPSHQHNRGKTDFNTFTSGDFEESRPGIAITDNVCLKFKKLGEVKLFTIEIESEEDIKLVCMYFPKINGQCRVLTELDHINLKAKRPFTVRCDCKVTNAGNSREILILEFDTFKMRRYINISVEELASNKGSCYQKTRKDYIVREKLQLLKGQAERGHARFIPVRMPEFHVPEKLTNLIVSYQHSEGLLKMELERVKPVLTSTLSFMNFEDKFHTLLHLDEIHMTMEMQNYDQEKACFIRSGEFLLLEIENLCERRPSIIAGDSVVAFIPNSNSKQGYTGCIHRVGRKHVYVKFAQIFHDTYDGEDYSIYIQALRTTYRREHWAVNLAVKNLGKDLLFPTSTVQKEAQVEFVYDSYFDSLAPNSKIDDTYEPFTNRPSHNTMGQKRILAKLKQFQQTKESFKIPKLEWFNRDLNFYQKEAVRNILLGVCRPLPYLIFGPPGTGKTVTLVETILQILRLIPHSRILVSAPSNSAADLLALRLIESGVVKPGDLIRLVARSAMNGIPAKLAVFSCTANVEKEGTETSLPVVTQSGLIEGLNSKGIGRHRITVTTCSTAGQLYSLGFPKGHFSHIIVDEAGQTSEPNVLIPLAFLDISAGQVIMAGDPMQLGPVVLSKLSCLYGLEETLLERLINKFPYQRDPEGFPNTCGYDPRIITKLLYNYRSLPDLLKLPSQLFYNDDLIPTVSEVDSKEANLLSSLKEVLPQNKDKTTASIIFHGVLGENHQTEDSPSWFNPNEASQTFYYVNELFRSGLNASDIGIITPYKAQVKQLNELFSEAEFIAPKIGTVEEFQGQEFNVIILSTVRSSKKYVTDDVRHTLGFVASPRRLNVSITRAKALLIIIGNPNLLVTDSCWQSVINYCILKGSYIGARS